MSKWSQDNEQHKKQLAAVLTSLANHQFLQSEMLKIDKNSKEAIKLREKAYKVKHAVSYTKIRKRYFGNKSTFRKWPTISLLKNRLNLGTKQKN